MTGAGVEQNVLRGRNKRNKRSVRVPKTNLLSVTTLAQLNSKGRFFSTSISGKILRSLEYTFILPKDWSCVFYNHKKKSTANLNVKQ